MKFFCCSSFNGFQRCLLVLALISVVKANTNWSTTGYTLPDTGEIVGFADLEADHYTDIFFVSESGLQLKVIPMKPQFRHKAKTLVTINPSTTESNKIRSIVLADFDGDSKLDVIILLSPQKNGPYKAYFIKQIGYLTEMIFLSSDTNFATFLYHPLLFYYDPDTIPDLLAMDAHGNHWKVWHGGNSNFHDVSQIETLDTQITDVENHKPIYSLFFDEDMDFSSEVMLTDYGESKFKFYKRNSSAEIINFSEPHREIDFPTNAVEISQPIVADWCLEDGVGLLVAYCVESACTNEDIKLGMFNLRNGGKWINVITAGEFSITLPNAENTVLSRSLVASLRTTHLNMDYYPDVVTTMIDGKGNVSIGALINQCSYGTLEFRMERYIDRYATEVIPFDFTEDGIPDLLVNREAIMELHKTTVKKDGEKGFNFVTVSMLPGHCIKEQCPKPMVMDDDSPHESLPYGIPMSGVTASLNFRDTDGKQVGMRGHTVSSTSYLALQLPFYVFCLPKKIKELNTLTVALPRGDPSIRTMHAVHFQVQVVINSFGANNPDKWEIELIRFLPKRETKISYLFPLLFTGLGVFVIGVAVVAVVIVVCRRSRGPTLVNVSRGARYDSML